MSSKETVYEKTYQYYLEQLGKIAYESVAPILGVQSEGSSLKIPLFTNEYAVSVDGITDASGNKPSHDICVILSKYILLCPDAPTKGNDWVTFRNFKDAGPLIGYFSHAVEQAISAYFSGRLKDLQKASAGLRGYAPALDVTYDFIRQFDALPMIPIILLYNDADAEFGASSSILFASHTEKYLDAECIAMLGGQLFSHLKNALKRQA